jgi:hypothetical protein
MKTPACLTCLLALTGFAGSAFAQLSSLPPPSTLNGAPPQPIGVNAGPTHWENPAGLGAYRAVSTTSGTAPITSPAYNPLGLAWASSIPAAVVSNMGGINTDSGTLRTIFVAESAGWLDDVGYTYSGSPQGPNSFTVWSNIENQVALPNPTFGSYFDVLLARGEAAQFDLWLNGVGDFGLANPAPPTALGGVYTAFHPENSVPVVGAGQVWWAQTPLMVNTFIPALGSYQDVSTYLLSFEDWRIDRGSDRDYSDTVLALQFFGPTGLPLGPLEPIPEPSTYGFCAAIALLGVIGFRRYRAKRRALAS